MIRVSEIFGPTVQGEGELIGVPTVFVRVGGCDFRCSWCDTPYAVLPKFKDRWSPMTAVEIFEQIETLAGGPLLVTLSGGNPALYDLTELLRLGHAKGYSFTLETQGTRAKDWFSALDFLTLSPKPPSSGMPFGTSERESLADCVRRGPPGGTSLKVVVFDEADFAFAREVCALHSELPVVLQVGNPAPNDEVEIRAGEDGDNLTETLLERYEWLIDQVREVRWHHVRVLPQLHVLTWGNRRGV